MESLPLPALNPRRAVQSAPVKRPFHRLSEIKVVPKLRIAKALVFKQTKIAVRGPIFKEESKDQIPPQENCYACFLE